MEEWRILNSGFEVDRPFFPPFVLVSFRFFSTKRRIRFSSATVRRRFFPIFNYLINTF
jgi:hypothetical protein